MERYAERIRALTPDERIRLRDAIALTRGTAARRLVAYILPRSGHAIDEAALADFARRELPAYMVPSAFVAVESFALTTAGKVDRDALADPFVSRRLERRSGAPRGAVEEALAHVWCDVLAISHVNRDDDFFAHLGGHSLLATRLLAAIQRAMNVALPVRLLFEAPTIAQLAVRIEDGIAGTPDDAPAIERLSREQRHMRSRQLEP